MPRPTKQDNEILEAALIGFQHQRDQIQQKIAELQSRIGGQPASQPAAAAAKAPAGKKRTMSASARRRIALAQKKRWAAFKAQHKTAAAPKPQKRKLSAAGRARIVAATKKRWAAFRKSQEAKAGG